MSAPTKRRHASYYLSLPLVIGIVFFAVVQLAAWQRAEIVADLAECVAHRDADEATAALRNLAAMPRPPVDVLVAAAASTDPIIADEAQHLINHLLRRWQRQLDSQRQVRIVSRQLGELADELAEQQIAFSTADPRWLRSTARTVLRLANRIPAKRSPLVAAQCDTVLAAVAASEISAAAFVDRQITVGSQPVTPVADAKPAESGVDRLEPELAAFAVRPLTTAGASMSATAATSDHEDAIASPAPLEQPAEPKEESQTSRVLRWSHPMLNWAPAMPIKATPADDNDGDEETSTTRPAPSGRAADAAPSRHSLADLESRELLARWLEADGSEVFPLEEEITLRGFGRLSARLVEQLFSEFSEDRLRLVDDVLTEPGVDARPWLLLLADDADADVRLLAVTIMATSDDATLIEKAWQVAINDHDPRIAGLAGRLRDRRESTGRR